MLLEQGFCLLNLFESEKQSTWVVLVVLMLVVLVVVLVLVLLAVLVLAVRLEFEMLSHFHCLGVFGGWHC